MRHSEPWQRDLEGALRRALCMAADSVEPGADGLDQIRSRIRARQQLPSGWHMAELAGPAGLGSFVRNLLSAGTAARAALHAAARLFRPGADRIGGYRWLRPAAALATGVFVVLAITWAITGLPQIVTSSASNGSVPGSAGGVPVAGGSGPAGLRTGSQSPVMSPSSSSPASYPGRYHGSTASARPPSASPTVPASSSPSASPTPPAGSSPSASPTPSASSSPAVSPTPSASCSPSGSPTPSGSSSPPGGKHCHHRGRHKQR